MKPSPRRLRNDPTSQKRLKAIVPNRSSQSLSASVAQLSPNPLQPTVTLATQLVELAIQASNQLHRFVDRCSELVPLALPSIDAVDLGRPASHLGVDLLAQLALRPDWYRLHDELHATGFTNSVLLGTVLAEVTPLPVAADEPVLIEEAHVSRAIDGSPCTLLVEMEGRCDWTANELTCEKIGWMRRNGLQWLMSSKVRRKRRVAGGLGVCLKR